MYKILFLLLLVITSLSANEIQDIEALLFREERTEQFSLYHVVKEVPPTDREVILEDGSKWRATWWYRNVVTGWAPGSRLKISFQDLNNVYLYNVDKSEGAWASFAAYPTEKEYIARISNASFEPDGGATLVLNNGCILKGPPTSWRSKERVFVFHTQDKEGVFEIWNLDRKEIVGKWTITGDEKSSRGDGILNIEKKLNSRVIGQEHATRSLSEVVINHWAGLSNPAAPIGVFLFLGPTGVGKTELAKTLAQALYKSQDYLIRFDMSHFSEPHSVSRLMGAPPGYVNHEQGGQLTEALRSKLRSIVLLDEIEKADVAVRKLFLPIFDEGFLMDSKNRKISCEQVIFIMTSNICAKEIAELFHKGWDEAAVLQCIEPALMQILSPELYNRVTPIVFKPLSQEHMEKLTDLMLQELTSRLKKAKNMEVVLSPSAKEYLIRHGFHPTLGARPLKRLIQSKIGSNLATTIVTEGIPDGSTLFISYEKATDSWHVTWQDNN